MILTKICIQIINFNKNFIKMIQLLKTKINKQINKLYMMLVIHFKKIFIKIKIVKQIKIHHQIKFFKKNFIKILKIKTQTKNQKLKMILFYKIKISNKNFIKMTQTKNQKLKMVLLFYKIKFFKKNFIKINQLLKIISNNKIYKMINSKILQIKIQKNKTNKDSYKKNYMIFSLKNIIVRLLFIFYQLLYVVLKEAVFQIFVYLLYYQFYYYKRNYLSKNKL